MKLKLKKGSKFAYTLAEVLITIGIIGVVVAMTMPSLIANYQEKETVAKLKKFYSSISQAYVMSKDEYGTPDNWYQNEDAYSALASNVMSNNIGKYLQVSKNCKQQKGCFPDVVYKKLDGSDAFHIENHGYSSKIITADGMSVFFYSYGMNKTNWGDGFLSDSYGAITVDVNGFKKPNVFGKDTFSFILTREGVMPFGVAFTLSVESFPKACNRRSCAGHCEGCAGWVIYNENMDYLHCDDLSWNGKTKCK